MKVKLLVNGPKKTAEGEWFEVNPLTINQEIFQIKRKDQKQENIRLLICEAFAEVKKNPEKYGRCFRTLIPEKNWSTKKVWELKELASKLGDGIADWVYQALEWAQKIENEKFWEELCNQEDENPYYRLILWKNGCMRIAGGAAKLPLNFPAASVDSKDLTWLTITNMVVPLVVVL